MSTVSMRAARVTIQFNITNQGEWLQTYGAIEDTIFELKNQLQQHFKAQHLRGARHHELYITSIALSDQQANWVQTYFRQVMIDCFKENGLEINVIDTQIEWI